MGRSSDAEERLIEQAARLWHIRSYADVGVNEICDAAGVRKGSFYHFFASKRDLALAVIEAHRSRQRREVIEPALHAESPLERVRLLAEGAILATQAEASELGCVPGCPFGNLSVELSTIDDVVRTRLDTLFAEQVALVRGLLDDAVAAGELPADVDTETSARAMLAYFEGVLASAKNASDPAVVAQLLPLAMRLVGAPDVPAPASA